jgi:hypothetical protein
MWPIASSVLDDRPFNLAMHAMLDHTRLRATAPRSYCTWASESREARNRIYGTFCRIRRGAERLRLGVDAHPTFEILLFGLVSVGPPLNSIYSSSSAFYTIEYQWRIVAALLHFRPIEMEWVPHCLVNLMSLRYGKVLLHGCSGCEKFGAMYVARMSKSRVRTRLNCGGGYHSIASRS